jgi:DNA-binding MarR family transcriptional regulator
LWRPQAIVLCVIDHQRLLEYRLLTDHSVGVRMATNERAELIAAIVDAFATMMRSRGASGPEPWLDLDLTLPQMKVLMLLDAVGASRPSEIAEATGATANGVTGIVDRLSERSLVRREPDPQDRRAQVVRLEPAGEAVMEALHTAGQSYVRELLQGMNDGDLRVLRRGMTALVREIDVRDEPQEMALSEVHEAVAEALR